MKRKRCIQWVCLLLSAVLLCSAKDTEKTECSFEHLTPTASDEVGQMLMRFAQGDTEVESDLFTQVRRLAFRRARNMGLGIDDAEDIAQDTSHRIAKKPSAFRGGAGSTWVSTIATNLALNLIRNRRRKPTLPMLLNEEGRPIAEPATPTQDSPTQIAIAQEMQQRLLQAIEALNENQRLAIALYQDGVTYAEAANTIGITVKAYKSLLARARENIRAALEPPPAVEPPPSE